MKKDRNTFFNESSFQQSYGGMMPNYGMPNTMPMNNGFGSQSSQSFYAGPMNMNYNPNLGINQPTNDYSDLEARLSKLERQINRLDARLNKLETNGFYSTDDF